MDLSTDFIARCIAGKALEDVGGKQDKLTTEQLTAVNSGITSADVEQITANKTNISTLSRITIANKRYSAMGLTKKWEVDFSGAVESIYFISIDYNGSISLYAFTYYSNNVQNLTAMYVTPGNEVSSVVLDENQKLIITFNEYTISSRRIATLSSCALW